MKYLETFNNYINEEAFYFMKSIHSPTYLRNKDTDILNKYKEYRDFLSKIEVNDISFNTKNNTLFLKFNENINKKLKEYEKSIPKNLILNREIFEVENMGTLYSDCEVGNRIHTNNIGKLARGVGLGLKSYKAACNHLGWISSVNEWTMGNAQKVWYKLLNSNKYNYILGKKPKFCTQCDNTGHIECPKCRGYDEHCLYCKGTNKVECKNPHGESQFVYLITKEKGYYVLNNLPKVFKIYHTNV